MTEEKSKLETWEEVIVDFLTGKKIAEEEKYIKDEIKKVADYYKRQKYYGQQDIEDLFDPKKSKKDKDQLTIDFQRQKRQGVFALDQKPEDLDCTKLNEDYAKKCADLANKYAANSWISKAAHDASSVSFATHVAKLTHSKIDSPSLYDVIASIRTDTLTTSNLVDKAIDGAVAGNQFAPIFQFLELELKGNKLAAEFANDINKVLEPFTQNSEELAIWNTNFQKALSGDRPSSHSLAKQVYFPVELENTIHPNAYHLLCHMKSSSLAHAIYHNLFDERQKEPKELRNKAKYSEIPTLSFINNARLSVTASNHSNASQLNGKRGGKLHLFSTQPPTWQSQLKPPLYKKSLFDAFSHSSITVDIDYLRDYLLRFERIELSIKNPQRRQWIEKWVGNIIDELLNYAATIQTLPAGWSNTENSEQKSKLKPEHQYFLDPYRPDDIFQHARKASDWQSVVCNDFSHWLNYRLIGKDKKFTPQAEHSRLWATLLEQPLREYSQLFSTQPPSWQSQLKPLLYKKSLFDAFPHQNINADIDYLRGYLLSFDSIELSIKNPQRLQWVEKWVANIIDELLNYAATIQTLPVGWSNVENSKLKPEHQYFLDPYRPDEVFQNARKASHWQSVVCNDFSRWLNRKLVGKDKKFTPQVEHSRLWATLLEQPLREYNQMIEADSRLQDKESA